jgi:tRNA nucleotidyltransferase (CCA-adding enzyme)
MAARLGAPLPVCWAGLGHDLGKGTTPRAQWPRHPGHEERGVRLLQRVHERLRVPNDCRELAVLLAREHVHVHQSAGFGAAALVRLFDRCDAWRRPDRFGALLLGCECDARGRAGREEIAYEPARRLPALLAAALGVDTAAVAAAAAARGASGPAIGAAVRAAREAALQAALDRGPGAPDAPDTPPAAAAGPVPEAARSARDPP